MKLSRAACCAALIVALAQTIAPAAACDGPDCRMAAQSARPGKPLQLGQFMRPAKTKNAVHSSKRHSGLRPVATARKQEPAPAMAQSKQAVATVPTPTIPAGAASAFASQTPAVRVVASDEFNEIDRTAGPAAVETTGAGPSAEPAAKLVDAAEYNALDRNSDELRMASLAETSGRADAPTQVDQAGRSWIERLWTRLQYTFIALAAAVRYLIG